MPSGPTRCFLLSSKAAHAFRTLAVVDGKASKLSYWRLCLGGTGYSDTNWRHLEAFLWLTHKANEDKIKRCTHPGQLDSLPSLLWLIINFRKILYVCTPNLLLNLSIYLTAIIFGRFSIAFQHVIRWTRGTEVPARGWTSQELVERFKMAIHQTSIHRRANCCQKGYLDNWLPIKCTEQKVVEDPGG